MNALAPSINIDYLILKICSLFFSQEKQELLIFSDFHIWGYDAFYYFAHYQMIPVSSNNMRSAGRGKCK